MKGIANEALMMETYLVTEEDNDVSVETLVFNLSKAIQSGYKEKEEEHKERLCKHIKVWFC